MLDSKYDHFDKLELRTKVCLTKKEKNIFSRYKNLFHNGFCIDIEVIMMSG